MNGRHTGTQVILEVPPRHEPQDLYPPSFRRQVDGKWVRYKYLS